MSSKSALIPAPQKRIQVPAQNVVTRRTKYDLNKAEERDHILQGLLIALDNIDEVVKIIRESPNVAAAKASLV
ncbi:MAG: DNA gyrase subunit A, partial [Candidatus Geothermincolales bacterium]